MGGPARELQNAWLFGYAPPPGATLRKCKRRPQARGLLVAVVVWVRLVSADVRTMTAAGSMALLLNFTIDPMIRQWGEGNSGFADFPALGLHDTAQPCRTVAPAGFLNHAPHIAG